MTNVGVTCQCISTFQHDDWPGMFSALTILTRIVLNRGVFKEDQDVPLSDGRGVD